MSTPKPQHTDLAIIGGGLVGALLALLLAREGLSVRLVEKKIIRDWAKHGQQDTRMLGLNAGSVSLFEAWNLAEVIFAQGQPITHIHVSDQHHSGIVNIDAKDEGMGFLGYGVPFTALLRDLQTRLERTPGIEVLEGEITRAQSLPDQVEFEVDQGHYHADMLIGADGEHSFVREALGIQTEYYDYEESAFIMPVEMTQTKPGWAFERFTAEGPVALLPRGPGKMTLVWVMPSRLVALRQKLPPAVLLEDLQNIFGYRAGVFTGLGQGVSYPLKRVISTEIYRGRMGLLGNAAHLIHPVAGQGFNLSVRDILSFVEALRCRGTAPLGEAVWQTYLEATAKSQQAMTAMTHTLVKVFGHSHASVSSARNVLLHGVEACHFAKTMLNDFMIGRM